MKVTLKEIARKANCSVAVASSVLNNGTGNVGYSKEVALRVRHTASALRFRNTLCPEGGKPGWVALAAYGNGDVDDLFSSSFIRKFTSLLDQNGCQITHLPIVRQDLSSRLQRLCDSEIDLTAIAALNYMAKFDSLDYIKSMGLPYMFLNAGLVDDSNCIIMDDEGGCRQAVNFLKATGKKKILYLTSKNSTHVCLQVRKKTIQDECAAAGIEISGVVCIHDLNLECLKHHLEGGVDVVVSYGASHADGLISMLFRAGYDVPGDVGLLALDDYTGSCNLNGIDLTCLSLPLERMAEVASMALLEMIKSAEYHFENILLPEYLVVGDSCVI